MDDLGRFFQQLVANLVAARPGRLGQQLQVADIQQDILPYRANRRALGLDSAEDYEILLLRLCAGEGGFARTEPPELQARCRRELAGSNPDLTLLRTHAAALVFLTDSAVAGALAADPYAAYAPPRSPEPTPEETLGPASGHTATDSPEHDLIAAQAAVPPDDETRAAVATCIRCGGALPLGRQVNFCPHCGQNLRVLRCPVCQSEVEHGWRHCVTCGAPTSGG